MKCKNCLSELSLSELKKFYFFKSQFLYYLFINLLLEDKINQGSFKILFLSIYVYG